VRSVGRTASALRSTSWLGVAALALHQLRYLAAGAGPSHGNHGYLGALAPAVVALALTLALGAVLFAAAGRPWGARVRVTTRARPFVFGSALLLIFAGQELAEALLAGHHFGLDVFEGAGGVVFPLAAALGILLATLLGRLDALERRLIALSAAPRRARRDRARHVIPSAPTIRLLPSLPLEFGLARRPPPLTSFR
jgi:hypothetical protein